MGITPLDLAVRILDVQEHRSVRLVGQGDGGEHRVAFDLILRFVERDGATQVEWEGEIQAFGGLASLTQRILPALLRDQIMIVVDEAERSALWASGTT